MTKLYYTAPPDEAFEEMKKACLDVWGQYKNSPGGYMEEKTSRIKDIWNVQDNFMYMLAMFDQNNQRMVISKLSGETKNEVRARMIDGGNDYYYLFEIGL